MTSMTIVPRSRPSGTRLPWILYFQHQYNRKRPSELLNELSSLDKSQELLETQKLLTVNTMTINFFRAKLQLGGTARIRRYDALVHD